ncbi:hypothetical protein [Persicobacter psychrovividus]|uniref:Uncharacterized protein n=1 Tax=Persicobacter psychrovividus TaxID=387638 RepID=A0ABN6L8R1_9BACT|nr:hypothetical protein PEPS_18040 [Persicobacter psychrovividus]
MAIRLNKKSTILFILGLLLSALSITAKADNTHLRKEKNFNFSTDRLHTDPGIVQGKMILLSKNGKMMFPQEPLEADEKAALKMLDIEGSHQKNAGQYYILLSRVAFLVNKSQAEICNEDLCSLATQQALLPNNSVSKIGDHQFQLTGGIMSPDFKYSLQFPAPLQPYEAFLSNYLSQDELAHTQISIQKNYDFGRVLFHKTSQKSYIITTYTRFSNDKTLIQNFTINYIYNIPPDFLGGISKFESAIWEGILDFVDHFQSVIPAIAASPEL